MVATEGLHRGERTWNELMPRKDDPRWGEDGYENYPTLMQLSDDEAAELARMLGLDPASEKAKALRSDVKTIGDDYRRWKTAGASAFTRAEARKALEQLLDQERITPAALRSLNWRAQNCVYDALLEMGIPPITSEAFLTVSFYGDQSDQSQVRQAIADAIARLKARKGQERDGDTAFIVAELCRLYERLTGRQVTHSNKGKHMAYEQAPQSDAGQFVHQCFMSIDPELPPSKISLAMRFFIEGRTSPP